MNSELNDFYQTWSKDRAWLIEYDNEVAGRKVDAILQGMPEIYDLDIKSMIDFGCGFGRTIRDFHEKMKLDRSYGFDITDSAINYAKQNFTSHGLGFHQLATLDASENARFIKSIIGDSVDAILLIDLLEHVPDCHNLLFHLSGMTKYFIIILPIEENIVDNYFINKMFPSSKHYHGHVREFSVNSVHYFISKLGLTPVAEGIQTYEFRDSYGPERSGPITLKDIKSKLLKYTRMILAQIMPKKIYLRLIGYGRYYCIATYNKEHILNP